MIKPSEDFLLVDRIVPKSEREDTTESGIVISRPKQSRDDLAVQKATVLAVGDNIMNYKAKDIVYYNYFAGNTIVVEGKDPLGKDDKEYHLVWKDDIIAHEG